MHTIPAEHDRELETASMGPRDPATVEARRDVAVGRLRAGRDALAGEATAIGGIAAFRDDEWSVMHVLDHVAEGGDHFYPVFDILAGHAELEPIMNREKKFHDAVEGALDRLDADIAFATGLTSDQLLLSARRSGRECPVIGFIEAAADHVDAHLAQLRAIKVRIEETRERRREVA